MSDNTRHETLDKVLDIREQIIKSRLELASDVINTVLSGAKDSYATERKDRTIESQTKIFEETAKKVIDIIDSSIATPSGSEAKKKSK